MKKAQRDDLTRTVLKIMDEANPMWPLFFGHPQTGEPVQMSKETHRHIQAVLRDSLDPPRQP